MTVSHKDLELMDMQLIDSLLQHSSALVFGHTIEGVFKHLKNWVFKEYSKQHATVQVLQNLFPILTSALNPWITLIQSYITSHPFQALSTKNLLFKGFSSAFEI